MHSTVEAVESPLDVIISFSEEEWRRARSDPGWAASRVIEELRKHKDSPELYFATRPGWAAALFSWEDRIKMEILGHMLTNDREIRFSEWWMFRLRR